MSRRLPPPSKGKPLDRETPPKKPPIPSRRLPPGKKPPPSKGSSLPQELGSGVLSQPSGCVITGSGCVPKNFDNRVHCIACSGSGISSVKTKCVPCNGTGRKQHGTY